MMKLGYSSRVCPQWDLETIVTKASTLGFDGVELDGLEGEHYLPLVAQLAGQPDRVRQLFQEHEVELVCLATSATLDSKRKDEIARQREALGEFFELAAKLKCPYVRMGAGKVQGLDHSGAALSRIADALRSIAPVACRYGVTLLVENSGDFIGSREMWLLIDAVGHPAVRCCWSQCQALTIGEHATRSVPRLSHKIDLVHLSDATFDPAGNLLDHRPLGKGDTRIERQIELLTGIIYDGYLVYHPLGGSGAGQPPGESVLSEVVAYLRERVDRKQAILSAYKADKQAPRFKVPAISTVD